MSAVERRRPVEGRLDAPYLLVGTVEEIVTKLDRLRQRWGFTRYTMRDGVSGASILAALAGGQRAEE